VTMSHVTTAEETALAAKLERLQDEIEGQMSLATMELEVWQLPYKNPSQVLVKVFIELPSLQ
jgi:hypothetical protein